MPEQPIVVDAGSYSMAETSIAGAGHRLYETTQVLSRDFRVQVIAPPTPDAVDLGEAELVEVGPEAEKAVLFFDTAYCDRLELAAACGKLIANEFRAPIEHMHFTSLLANDGPTGDYQRYLSTYQRQLQVTHHFLCWSPSERPCS